MVELLDAIDRESHGQIVEIEEITRQQMDQLYEMGIGKTIEADSTKNIDSHTILFEKRNRSEGYLSYEGETVEIKR